MACDHEECIYKQVLQELIKSEVEIYSKLPATFTAPTKVDNLVILNK